MTILKHIADFIHRSRLHLQPGYAARERKRANRSAGARKGWEHRRAKKGAV